MKTLKFAIYSFLITLVLWTIVSWPLPLHTFSGIPASPRSTESNNVRAMTAGDHLQFLYHMWLARDTFLGHTPLFYNLYEFNRGNTEERRDTSTRYYLPFSLFYTLFAYGGQSFGWNATGFLTLWITFVFTWLLARRYSRDPYSPILAAAISIIFPFRWITLTGGSPTGLAMMWIPIAFYGLDVMVRDKKVWGAMIAGAAIFLSGWADSHVFFFTALCTPCWCIVAYMFNAKKILPDKTEIKKLSIAAIPLLIFAALIILQAKGVKGGLQDTALGDNTRLISEVALFSPAMSGLCAWNSSGHNEHIYVGWFLIALLTAGMLSVLAKTFSRDPLASRAAPTAILLFLGAGAIMLLSTGTNNPGGSLFWLRLCKVIPPYGMIRQSAKIFIVLPTIIAVFLAIAVPFLADILRAKTKTKFICIAIAAILTADYGRRIDPAICTLDPEQGAYKAVAEDARSNGEEPCALAIPLWPGDSHWSSLNQYYSTLYRVRMVNGYRPTRRQTYFEDIFLRFRSFNDGHFSDKQLKTMQDRGMNYIILHEDAFPEKVSAFSVANALHSLLAHPSIKLLQQDGPVWAFKIVTAPEGVYENIPDWNHYFPSRNWEAERGAVSNGTIQLAEDTSSGKYVHLPDTNSFVVFNSTSVQVVPNLRYIIRTRGTGSYYTIMSVSGELFINKIEAQPEWSWQDVPVAASNGFIDLQLRVEPAEQPLEVDAVMLAAGEWTPNTFQSPLVIPAPVFFHAGYTDLETGEVVLSPDREPADVIFYGPKLPLPAGVYKISLEYSTDAKDGTILGSLSPRYGYDEKVSSDIIAGQPAELVCNHPVNLRFALDVKFNRNGLLRIKNVEITTANERK